MDAPIKTGIMVLERVAKSMVASWVLSPSSAMNTKPNVVNSIFHIVYLPHVKAFRNIYVEWTENIKNNTLNRPMNPL